MEKEMEELTRKMAALCVGKNMGAVIGASFNMIQSSINHMPDQRIKMAVAQTLRQQADCIEQSVIKPAH
jgi:hypothetical protein